MNPWLGSLLDAVRGAWRYRWLGVAVAVVAALLGWAVVFARPDLYEASARVLVDSHAGGLSTALQGLTPDQDLGAELNYVRQSLLVDRELCPMALQAGLMPSCASGAAASAAQQARLAILRTLIKLTVTSPDGNNDNLMFEITYRDPVRAHALKFVSVLTRTLEDKTLGGKRRGAEDARQFLARQLQDAERSLKESEDKLDDFKARHAGTLPTDEGGYAGQLQKETEAVEDAQTRLRAAENRRATLENQLRVAATTSVAPMTSGGTGAEPLDTASQIAATQAHLDELLLRFTEKHPDVIAAREQLAELKKRRALEIQNVQKGDAAAVATSGAALNPVYQSVQLAINQADVDISAVRAELEQHQDKVRELREQLSTEPQIESEYDNLTRINEANRNQFAALQASYEKSNLGDQAAAAEASLFRVVQPPTASTGPVSSKRPLLLTLALLFGLAAGSAAAYGLDRLHPVVGSAAGLTQLTGVPVLAAIGSAYPTQFRRHQVQQVRQVAIVLALLVCALAVVQVLSHQGVRL